MWRVGPTIAAIGITIFAAARPAAAQQDNTLALGVSYTQRLADSSATHVNRSIGLAWRFGHGDTGWGPTAGLGWFAADIDRPIGGLTTEIGELHVKPLLAGYGYTYAFRRFSVSAELLGGFAFVSFHQAPVAADVYRDRLGARSVGISASNTLALRPQSNVWIDTSDRFGVNISVAYAVIRPRLTTATSLGRDSRRVNADNIGIGVGLVYKIF
jgi:hypothetical protein